MPGGRQGRAHAPHGLPAASRAARSDRAAKAVLDRQPGAQSPAFGRSHPTTTLIAPDPAWRNLRRVNPGAPRS
jgi:hypothetical protein